MDRDREQTREPEGTNHLPREMIAEVAMRLPTSDPVETARNITNIKLANRSTREAVETSPVGPFHKQVKRLGNVAKVLFRGAIPDDSFPEHSDAVPGDRVVYPSSRVHSAGPILKYQSVQAKTTMVDNILNLSTAFGQAHAISSLGRHLGDLDDANRTRLVGRAIEIFKEEGPVDLDSRRSAAQAIMCGHNYLNAGQKAQILDAIVDRPELAGVYTSMFYHRDPRNAMFRPPSAEAPKGSHLDTVIDGIERSVSALTIDTPINSFDEMVPVRSIGKSINESYDRARKELVASPRSRENAGLAR
ncbi:MULTISPECIES: hypothetical protein [Mesorhizobium]|uniref:hypothetical protein n=1 Tax=Mesorhizobium TaxID=68287 RepID=UPI0010136043|nr:MULTISPECIES: hypothetical protein [Mesorhizobium]